MDPIENAFDHIPTEDQGLVKLVDIIAYQGERHGVPFNEKQMIVLRCALEIFGDSKNFQKRDTKDAAVGVNFQRRQKNKNRTRSDKVSASTGNKTAVLTKNISPEEEEEWDIIELPESPKIDWDVDDDESDVEESFKIKIENRSSTSGGEGEKLNPDLVVSCTKVNKEISKEQKKQEESIVESSVSTAEDNQGYRQSKFELLQGDVDAQMREMEKSMEPMICMEYGVPNDHRNSKPCDDNQLSAAVEIAALSLDIAELQKIWCE